MKLKWIRPAKVEWISYLVMMPFLGMALNYLLFGPEFFSRLDVWLFSYPIIVLTGFISWYLHIVVMHRLRQAFPLITQTKLRLALLAASHVTLISLTFALLFYTYDAFHFLDYTLNPAKLRVAFYLGIGITLVAASMWEAEYTMKQWKESLAEKEKLEQLTLQQEFDTLKGQVNPHFLFNCFNTLSSLIAEDRRQAEVFLNELSKVYRYLLKNNRDGLSTLSREIAFIESYYQLLKTRHGEAVELHIEIDKKFEHYLLPSLSLQMLVENAVKHNVLSKAQPLVIDIFTTAGNKLVVSNNLQARPVKAPSNRIGLENIRQKYQLLKEGEFQVLEDKRTFTVVLPLIWNKIPQEKLSAIE